MSAKKSGALRACATESRTNLTAKKQFLGVSNKVFPTPSGKENPSPRPNFEQNLNESASPQVGEKEQILRKTKQTNLCSLTGVNPLRTHGFGVWGGKRVVVGVRVDERLYEAFKPVAKLVFGSICRPIEAFMAAVVASNQTQQLTSKLGVNPSNTVEIGKLVIERNVRSRRRLVVEETKEVREVVQKEKRVVQKPKRKPIDYSKLSLEELQSLFDKARKLNRMGQMQTIAFEMKKRGISRRSY